ncbi:MFS transporter [Streptomyces sp. A1136]|uniref:MFS transporter n=1 Tax=Streptomyces sp. A1136 TaxID=2563102 RepID=UPI00109EC3A2|nr:MFS transporter [Streptomyces sp. A1136]THA47100.1 MFS transporter [Streptomyces sp. A1136]
MSNPHTEQAGARPPVVTRPLLLRFVSIIGASTSFYLLLSVVPLYAEASSGGNGTPAGLATGALMLATVGGELATPRFVARFGYRLALAVGLVLLGAPALVLTASGSTVWITAVCVLRGLGFALTVVAGGAMTASLIPPERRGEGLALVGIVSGVPSLVALPLGVWLVARVGYGPVGIASAVAALAAIVSVPGLPHREPTSGRSIGVLAGLRTAALLRPAVLFSATALAAGIIVTFLPLAVPPASTGVVAGALFVQSAASTVARWGAGRHGDRHGPASLVLPALAVSAAGTLLTSLTHSPVAVVAGVALFGVGFGVTQNATLTLMYARVPTSGYGTVSALWNFAYDAGMGVGAVGFGVLTGQTGYPVAFALTAMLTLTALVPAWRDGVTTGSRA